MVPHMIHRLKAKGELAAGRVDSALAEIDICMMDVPGDVDVAIELVPELEKLKHPQAADAIFEKSRAFYLDLIKNHPNSGTLHNSLAWLNAKCGRRLDEANDHAAKAVAIDEKSSAFLDTLAEVQFQRGDKPAAIATIKKAIEATPKSDYLKTQLSRFQGLPTTKPAEEPEED